MHILVLASEIAAGWLLSSIVVGVALGKLVAQAEKTLPVVVPTRESLSITSGTIATACSYPSPLRWHS